MSNTKPIPEGYDSLIPYLTCRDAAKAIDFYKQLFGATEVMRMTYPGSPKVMHAELKIRNWMLMVGEENLQMGAPSPDSVQGGNPVTVMVYVTDTDGLFAKAVKMGATAKMPPTDMFWGDRFCKFTDPFGHNWAVATHKEDLSPEEQQRRGAEACKNMPK